MDVKSLQQLVLNRLRSNLKDVRTSNFRNDTRKWILSKFPNPEDSKNLDEFKEKHGYPLLIVQTPALTSAVMYSHGGLEKDFSLNIHIQHAGALSLHDSLVDNIFADFKKAIEDNFYLNNNLYVDEISFEPDDDNFTTDTNVFNSVITVKFKEDND
jgi:hypothetical protein